MNSVLLLASIRYQIKHPWLLLLSVLGIALGVAVVVAIDLTNRSAIQSFTEATDALSGHATHRIIGGPQGVSSQVYVDLRIKLALRDIAPVVEGYVSSPQYQGESFHILASDSFARTPFDFNGPVQGDDAMTKLLVEPASILLFENTASRLGLVVGDSLGVTINGQLHGLNIVGLIPVTESLSAHALENLIVMDIASGQELFGLHDFLTRIELVLPDADPALIAKINAHLPAGTQLIAVDNERGGIAQLTRAFRANLNAMSLLALLVGVFIIYNSMSFSVVQRRKLFGTLRAIGVTGVEIGRLVLLEALLIGLIGALLGGVLGIILCQALLGMVSQTINDLYSQVSSVALSFDLALLMKGIVLGVLASLVAAIVPMLEAIKTTPRIAMQHSAMEKKIGDLLPKLAIAGGVLLLVALGVIAISERSLNLSFFAIFLWIIGYVLLIPLCVAGVVRQLRQQLSRRLGLMASMVFQGLYRNLSRTAVALAAMTVAVATTLGVTTMTGSFREAVTDWVEHSLRADVYITMPSQHDSVKLTTLDQALIEQVRGLTEVNAISLARRVQIQTEQGQVELLALDLPEQGFRGFELLEGDLPVAWNAYSHAEAFVLVSEPYAYRYTVSVGDSIELASPLGMQYFKVSGVFRDYGSEHGKIVIPLSLYSRYWLDDGIDTIGIYTRGAGEVAENALLVEVKKLMPIDTPLLIRSKASIRDATMTVFNRTFVITDVLRLLTLLVAGVGILSTLMALQLERGREFAILRATGLTIAQLRGLLFSETGLLGFIAGILAIPLGLSLAYLLIHVINKRSFGWGMSLHIDVEHILIALLMSVVTAMIAAVYPVYRMSRSSPALMLRGE